MAEESNKGLTWENRLALWLPGPPLLGAFLITLFLIAVYLGFLWSFGYAVYRITILVILMTAYLVMAPRYSRCGTQLEQQPGEGVQALSSRREAEEESLKASQDQIRKSRLAGLAGALALFAINGVVAFLEGADLGAWLGRLHPGNIMVPLSMLVGWLAGRGIYFTLASPDDSPLLDSCDVDLLNLDRIYAVGRTGLRDALLALFGISIGGLLFLDTAIGLWGTIPTFLTGLGIGLAVLLRPAREVRNLIRTVKYVELARLEPLLRQARDDTLTGDGSTHGRLTDLISYQMRIEATSEWSFDSTTLFRFGLYLLIPVGSMVGGALVERVVNMVLG